MKNLLCVPVIAMFICIQFACGNHHSGNAVSTSNPLVEITDSSVKIAYTDNGKGDTTLFFVHGWGINKATLQTRWLISAKNTGLSRLTGRALANRAKTGQTGVPMLMQMILRP